MQVVHFDMPPFINRSAVPKLICQQKTVSYRHMCRFHAKTLYDQPIVVGLQYVLRLDDDSFILKPVGYDIFRLMRDRRILYGYVGTGHDNCHDGVWTPAREFMRKRNITAKFELPWRYTYLNNFELSDLDLWLSSEYRDYFDLIDRTGGIYYHRWGDAPIKTIAVTLLLPKNRTHFFEDIVYTHGRGSNLRRAGLGRF